MINDEEIVQWAYLLDPAFQIVNTAGKPLTNGYIEVYYHGTRTKYYCASDFDGTLHPFKIPLDSLGSNIVLASPDYAYDIYIYNAFGSLIMSRYNVVAGKGGGGSGGLPAQSMAQHWLGQYGATQALVGNSTGQTLALPSRPDYQGDFIDHIDYGYINGDETNQYPKYIYLKPGLYLVNCVIRFQQRAGTEVNRLDETLVYTGNGNANEDVAWQLDETGPLANGDRHCLKLSFIRKVLDEGVTSSVDCSNILYFAPGPQVDWSDAYIQTLQIVRLSQGGNGGTVNMLKPGEGIAIDDDTSVISVTGMQPISGMGDYVRVDVFNQAVTSINQDIQYVSSMIPDEYTAGDGIIIDDHVISVDPDYIASVTGDVTQGELAYVTSVLEGDIVRVSTVLEGDIQIVSSALDAVSANMPETEEVQFEELDVSSLATKDDLASVSSAIMEDVSGDVTNLTEIINNVSGDVVNLTEVVNNVTGDVQNINTVIEGVTGDIQYVSGQVDAVSAAIPESEEVEFEELDVAALATKNELASATSILESEIQIVSAAIPDVSEFTTRDEIEAVTSVIENRIETVSTIQEQEIQFVSGAVDAVSASMPDTEEIQFEELDVDALATKSELQSVSTVLEGDIQIVSAAIPDVSEFPTRDEIDAVTSVIENTIEGVSSTIVNNIEGDLVTVSTVLEGDIQIVSAAIDTVSANMPETEDVTFEELDVDSLATKTELATASGDLHNEIQAVSAAVPDAQVNADWNAVSGKAEILNKPDLSVYATHDEVAGATSVIEQTIETVSSQIVSGIPEAQVQSDWTEDDTASKAYIQHKPQEVTLVAGDNIVLTRQDDYLIIAASGGDLSGYETVSGTAAVSGNLEAQIQAVSAAIPDAQVNADWNAVSGKAEILNKPDTYGIVAGDNITITVAGDDLIISAVSGSSATGDVSREELAAVSAAVEADIQTVSAAIPSLAGYATETYVNNSISGLATESDLQIVSAAIPDAQVNADWEATSGVAEILNKPSTVNLVAGDNISITKNNSELIIAVTGQPSVTGFATEEELQIVSAAIPAAQVNSDWNATSGVAEILNKPEVEEMEIDSYDLQEMEIDNYDFESMTVENLAAGQYVSISGGTISVTGVQPILTAVTDIQSVSALPANPVATVLYLIPET